MNPHISNAIKLLILVTAAQATIAMAEVDTRNAVQPESDKTAENPGTDTVPLQIVEVKGLDEAIGFSAARANIKITKEDITYYPPGVSADKVLERVSGIQQGSSNAFGGSTFDATINMRGFEKDSIGFSIDGIPNGRTTLGGGSVPARYFDSSNLSSVRVSQSAGEIGAPTNQALAGQINYLTADPGNAFAINAEVGYGSADTKRAYILLNTGEITPGLKAYISAARNLSQVSYISAPSGMNSLNHVDFKAVKEFDNGADLKFRYSYNDINENSAANIVTLNSFNANPNVDGYTDSWTKVAAKDVSYRAFYGNPRTDKLAYVSATLPLPEKMLLEVKAYNARQDGIGKFANLGNAYTALNGSANSVYYRANNYYTNRNGLLTELSGSNGQYFSWRVGGWIEQYHANQERNFYLLTDLGQNQDYSPVSSLTSSNLHWHDNTKLFYTANTSKFWNGEFQINYGITYLQNSVDFDAPIYSNTSSKISSNKFNYVNRANANSGILPKVGALYSLSPTLQLFAGFSKNAASISDPTVQANAMPASSSGNTVTQMDTSNAWDFGIRKKASQYSIGLQAFFIRSEQTFASDIATTLTKQNIPEGRHVKGIELNYKHGIGNWSIYAAVTIQQCKYNLSSVDTNGNPSAGFIRNNADCVGIANKNVFSELIYQPNSALKLAGTIKMKSDMASYYANPNIANSGVDETVSGVTLLGLNMSYKSSASTYGINIENLTNRHYISGVAPELESSSSASGRYFIGAPRTIYVWYKVGI